MVLLRSKPSRHELSASMSSWSARSWSTPCDSPLRAALVGDVVRVVRIVELHVGAALLDEGDDLVSDDGRGVGQHGCAGLVHLVRDAGLVPTCDHVAGGGHRHFVRPGRVLLDERRLVAGEPLPLPQPLTDDAARPPCPACPSGSPA